MKDKKDLVCSGYYTDKWVWVDCDKPAHWVRHTQFAGSHPFCDAHAREQKDFGKDDSYEFWEELTETSK